VEQMPLERLCVELAARLLRVFAQEHVESAGGSAPLARVTVVGECTHGGEREEELSGEEELCREGGGERR
jgi:hypothetical protein